MSFPFDVISGEEYDRQRASYDPLTDALRRLIDVGIHTAVDDGTVQEALRHLEAATELLERDQRTVTSTLRHAETGKPVAWANPAVGLRNAIAPPMVIQHEPDGSCCAATRCGPEAARPMSASAREMVRIDVLPEVAETVPREVRERKVAAPRAGVR